MPEGLAKFITQHEVPPVVCACVWERERESVCDNVCVCGRESERVCVTVITQHEVPPASPCHLTIFVY